MKALADPTRLRIINLLAAQPLCVCSIEQVLCVSQTAASRHLARLQSAGVLESERRAQWVYYSLDEHFVIDHAGLLDYLKQAAAEEAQLRQDRARLEEHIKADSLCESTVGSAMEPAGEVVVPSRTTRNKQKEYV